MHLMIFDPHERGHYFTYVRYLLRGAQHAHTVTLVLGNGVTQSVPFRQQLEPNLDRTRVDAAIRNQSWRDGRSLLEDFAAACQRHQPDHIWVPSGDLLLRRCNTNYLLGKFKFAAGVEAECGLIELRFHWPPRRWRGYLRQWFERSLLRNGPWARMHTIDPTVMGWVTAHRGRPGSGWERMFLMPEPLDPFVRIPKLAARRALGIPAEGRYVGSVGMHAIPRKGSHLLLEAFGRARLRETDRLLLAGSVGHELEGRLQADYKHLLQKDRVVLVDRYLDDTDVMNSVAAVDVVCTPYFDHWGSSAIVLRAAQAGRPVLAPRQGWFADVIPRFGLGDTGPILEVQCLASALEQAFERSEQFHISAAGQRLVDYCSADNFAAHWAVRLRERLGLSAQRLRTWEWVVEE
jgi:glycosyltransferase involved in cell wall biosynthesis